VRNNAEYCNNICLVSIFGKEHVFSESQGGCGVSFSGDIQDPAGQGPLQSAVGDPASAGGLD